MKQINMVDAKTIESLKSRLYRFMNDRKGDEGVNNGKKTQQTQEGKG